MKYIHFIFWFVVFVVLVVVLQTQYAFHFFYIEQFQLFQNTWAYVSDNLFRSGGLAYVLSEFFVQFFILPYWGPVILSLLFTGAGIFTWLIVRRITPKTDLTVLCLIPAITLLFITFEFNYLTWGTVAYLMTVISVWAVLYIHDFKKRLIAHLLVTLLLYCLAGSVYVLYAVAVTVYELLQKSPSKYLVLLLLPEVALIGWGSVYFQVYPEYRFAFLPDMFYHTKRIAPAVIYFSWIALVLLIIAASVMKNKEVNGKKGYVSIGAQAVLMAVLCIWGIPKYHDAKSYPVEEMDYYCRTGQWDQILERCKGPLTNYLYLCYANMALSEKGELADKMFAYDQRGLQGLMVNWNRTAAISTLLNDIYFSINNIALSQEMAFEAYIGNTGNGNPRMLKRLVQTNLIYGAYPVAEKYIRILENTFCYSDWAKEHRVFLYNDQAVESDPLLGQKRRSLVASNTISTMAGMDSDLMQMAEQNPSAVSSIHFVGATYLLAKDLERFKSLLDAYYKTDVLPALPKSFQEAVITLYENNPDRWKEYAIEEGTIRKFEEYKKQILANKSNPNALPGLLKRAYGDTFWFYLMFK